MQRGEVQRRCVKYNGTDEDFFEILEGFINLQDSHLDYLIDEGEFDLNNVEIWLQGLRAPCDRVKRLVIDLILDII